MDKIAKTCGHYDAYRKGAEFDASLELFVPLGRFIITLIINVLIRRQ